MKDSVGIAKAHPLRCPFCEARGLERFGRDSGRCCSCGTLLGGGLLQTLRQIAELPDALGRHACECGHPEMRRLPDGVFHCPACGSEVLPPRPPGGAAVDESEDGSESKERAA